MEPNTKMEPNEDLVVRRWLETNVGKNFAPEILTQPTTMTIVPSVGNMPNQIVYPDTGECGPYYIHATDLNPNLKFKVAVIEYREELDFFFTWTARLPVSPAEGAASAAPSVVGYRTRGENDPKGGQYSIGRVMVAQDGRWWKADVRFKCMKSERKRKQGAAEAAAPPESVSNPAPSGNSGSDPDPLDVLRALYDHFPDLFPLGDEHARGEAPGVGTALVRSALPDAKTEMMHGSYWKRNYDQADAHQLVKTNPTPGFHVVRPSAQPGFEVSVTFVSPARGNVVHVRLKDCSRIMCVGTGDRDC